MQANSLHVVTAVTNPLRWQNRLRLYRDFEAHMLASGVDLTVVECALGERPFELSTNPRVRHVGVRCRTLVWTKENLVNLGIGRLPQDWKYVAWVDADIHFRVPHWASETVHALQQFDVVQPWSDCYDLGPRDEHIATHRAFCRIYQDRGIVDGSGYGTFAHPGYAWAATRQAVDHLGGLIETAALGTGDHHMALALAGRADASFPAGITSGYRRPVERWQARARQHIAGNIGYVPGTIEHGWHGAKGRRRYVERWEILTRHEFDPETDLKKNVWGVMELAGNKPELRRDIDAYFRQRDEDSNTLSG